MPRQAVASMLAILLAALVIPFSACGGGGGGGGGGGDEPKDKGFRVVSTTPIDNERAVARDVSVVTTFSDELMVNTVDADSLRVTEAFTGHVVLGDLSVDADGKTVRLAPRSLLALNTEYRLLITTDVLNRFGERMKKDYEGLFHSVVTDAELDRLVAAAQ